MIEKTSPLQYRDFRLYWLERFCAVLATSGMVVIVGYQIYDIARDSYAMTIAEASFMLGVLGLVQFIPVLVLAPLAGLVADRFDRRKIVALATGGDCLVALSLALVSLFETRSLPILFMLAALHATVRSFINPANSAIVPNVVPAQLLPRAIAFSSMAMQVGTIAGPAMAGLLFARAAHIPYLVSAALLAFTSASVLLIRPMAAAVRAADAHPLRDIAEGFRYVWHERFLLGCITLDLFAVLLGGATALLPVFARDILHVGPEGLGQMRAAPALGAVLVSIWLAWRPLQRNVGAVMLFGVAAYGAATIGFGLSRAFPLSLLFLALLGAADMLSVFVRSSLVQLNTPNAMRGRVSATSGLAISASNELGEMQSGIAAALLGATGAVVFGGTSAILITVAWALLFPELRKARTFAPHYRQKEPAP